MKRSLIVWLSTAVAAVAFAVAAPTSVQAAKCPMGKNAKCTMMNTHYKGRIESLDVKDGTLTLEHHKTTEVIGLAKNCKFDGFPTKVTGLADLTVGEHVCVNYTKSGDKLLANKIVLINHHMKKSEHAMTSHSKTNNKS